MSHHDVIDDESPHIFALKASTMLKKNIICAVLYLAFVGSVESKWLAYFDCPTSDDYSPQCLEIVTPPWPICLLKSSHEWVDKAIDSASRCCGDDLSECKCPKKDTEKFLDKIDEYCNGVATCSEDKKKLIAEKIEENFFAIDG
jgi:hypothetical protein